MAKLAKQEILNDLQLQLNSVGFDFTKKETKEVFDAYTRTIEGLVDGFASGEYDAFGLDFVTVKADEVNARQGVSALNGKEWSTPAHKTVRFKLASKLKETLKEKTSK